MSVLLFSVASLNSAMKFKGVYFSPSVNGIHFLGYLYSISFCSKYGLSVQR